MPRPAPAGSAWSLHPDDDAPVGEPPFLYVSLLLARPRVGIGPRAHPRTLDSIALQRGKDVDRPLRRKLPVGAEPRRADGNLVGMALDHHRASRHRSE